MQVLLTAVWTNVGAAVTYGQSVLNTVDLYIDGNSGTGTATLFLSGTERESATADFTSITGIDELQFHGVNSAAGCSISQVIVADEPTIGWRLTTVPPTGAGATTDWTGTYAEVDEIVYSDADFINSSVADQVELFSHGTAIPSGYRVRAVVVAARAKRGGSGPQSLQLALRSSGTTYVSSTKALGVGYDGPFAVWEEDPATTADFTSSSIAALQFGVKSIA
jgi:hypothetical protein